MSKQQRVCSVMVMGLLGLFLLCGTNAVFSAEPSQPEFPGAQVLDDCPVDFPRFEIPSHPQMAQALNRFLWYFFKQRSVNDKFTFQKEYLTIADMWLGGATETRQHRLIQEIHRDHLLNMGMDQEGYVFTHQGFAYSHDHGWPFPTWINTVDRWGELTVGWLFKEDGEPWEHIWPSIHHVNDRRFYGEGATEGWHLENLRSLGIQSKDIGIKNGYWVLEATGPSPSLTTPEGMTVDAFHAPFMQLRWSRTGTPRNHAVPYLEWQREEDNDFDISRRVYLYNVETDFFPATHSQHAIAKMYDHPLWHGKIKRMRLSLAPGETQVQFHLHSFFSVYDTRHPINNPIFIFSCWNYFRWTQDLDFLYRNINRMRKALLYQQKEFQVDELKRVRINWPGHDGISGWVKDPEADQRYAGYRQQPGHGIGNNYYDILPFGWDDTYATAQYYAALVTMASVETLISNNPGWGIPQGALTLNPSELHSQAEEIKSFSNRFFWDQDKGRLIGGFSQTGQPHDYGYTFLNQEAIWYGFVNPDHQQTIMDWISGQREIPGDTSTGEDIYRWRFAPRTTTLRNEDYYGMTYFQISQIPWGAQVQDGGAVLAFSFYDLWARLLVYGPEDAWQRLAAIMDWDNEVWQEGGYRDYYADGSRGNTLQGANIAGGLGIDCEFFENSMIPSAVIYGFLGINPDGDALSLSPQLPASCPEITVRNLLYAGVRLDAKFSHSGQKVELFLHDKPLDPIKLRLPKAWNGSAPRGMDGCFTLHQPDIVYRFGRESE